MPADTTTSPPAGGTHGASRADPRTAGDRDVDIAEAERRSGWRTIRKVVPYLWPDDKPG
jgi:hypothetical protein